MHGMIDNIKAVGYSGITFAYSVHIDLTNGGIGTSTNNCSKANNGTQEDIARMLALMDYAYSKGLNVSIKNYWSPPDDDGNINQWTTGVQNNTNWVNAAGPTNGTAPTALALLNTIDNYFKTMVPIYIQHHVKKIVVGTENDFLTFAPYKSNWTTIINNIRAAGFDGTLTYDAIYYGIVGENFHNVKIWGELDVIGLSFYAPFSSTTLTNLSDVVAKWSTTRTNADLCRIVGTLQTGQCHGESAVPNMVTDLINIKTQWSKPIHFTENTFQNSELALMNWVPADKLIESNHPPAKPGAFKM